MKNGFVAFTVLVALVSTASNAFAGDKYIGRWGGQVSTSLEIVSKKRVIYCYDGDCNTLKVKGSLDAMDLHVPKEWEFPWWKNDHDERRQQVPRRV